MYHYGKTAYNEALKNKNYVQMITALNNIGYSFHEEGFYKKAETFYHQAIDLAKKYYKQAMEIYKKLNRKFEYMSCQILYDTLNQ